MATAREVLTHVDDESLGRTVRLGAALWSLPHGPSPDEDAPETAVARAHVTELLTELGWSTVLELGGLSPSTGRWWRRWRPWCGSDIRVTSAT
ncbi:hypothetical protein [Streptomyces sp. 1268]|uniref:hypothetical protein n=1 Tax=Streptomyces sp. 1268 TaxID=3231942 RepID=UPI0038D47833